MVVERVPIMRKAIHFTREPIHLDLLKWDDVYKVLNNYIKYASNQVACTATSRYSISEDLYQEGLLLLYQLWEQYKYLSLSDFLAVSKASIWRKLRKTAWKPGLQFLEEDSEGDDSPSSSIVDLISSSDDSFSTVYEHYKEQEVLQRLEDNLVAKKIFLELLCPSQETLWQQQMDIARKETVKSMGYRINVPKTVDLKGIYIQKALKLSNKLFKENFRLLQSVVYDVYAEDTEIKNYMASLEVA